MKVLKVLNNSLVFAIDDDGREMILMGKGIGYNKAIGYELHQQEIEKVFILKDREISKNIIRLAAEIDSKYFEIAKMIIDYAIEKYQMQLMEHIYLGLTDHLCFAVQRASNNALFQNFYTADIKKFNPHEYDVGQYALAILEEKIGIRLPEDEIGYIAFHFMNAQQNNPYSSHNQKIAQITDNILDIIKYHLKIVWDEESIVYTRMVTHIRLFAKRLVTGEQLKNKAEDFLFAQLSSSCTQAYACVKKIAVYVERNYLVEMTNQEELYLIIHVHRLIEEENLHESNGH